jgi:hypothetical protein
MNKKQYNKLKNHLESKLKFYQSSLANSERKTNFHGKKFHRVNSFEAAIRIEELNFLLSYLETEIKPYSILDFLKDKWNFFKIKIGIK